MNGDTGQIRPMSGWLRGALAVAAIAAAAALVFAGWWFPKTSAACGVVRVYEYIFGALLIGGWLAGTTVGLLLACIARRRQAKALIVVGCSLAILAGCAFMGVAAKTVHTQLAANLAFSDDPQLLELLAKGNLDNRKLAAHKLGERRVREAIPPLCDLLRDAGQDINLRHNAAIALGKICAAPYRQEADTDLAVNTLNAALPDRGYYLASSVAEALGNIGDPRAIAPLAGLLNDASRDRDDRVAAARALGKIDGEAARAALINALEICADDYVRDNITRILKSL